MGTLSAPRHESRRPGRNRLPIIGLAHESGLPEVSAASADTAESDAAEKAYLVAILALIINTLAGPILIGGMIKWRDQNLMGERSRGRWGSMKEDSDALGRRS